MDAKCLMIKSILLTPFTCYLLIVDVTTIILNSVLVLTFDTLKAFEFLSWISTSIHWHWSLMLWWRREDTTHVTNFNVIIFDGIIDLDFVFIENLLCNNIKSFLFSSVKCALRYQRKNEADFPKRYPQKGNEIKYHFFVISTPENSCFSFWF